LLKNIYEFNNNDNTNKENNENGAGNKDRVDELHEEVENEKENNDPNNNCDQSKISVEIDTSKQNENEDEQENSEDESNWVCPYNAVPMRADVRTFNFELLREKQLLLSNGELFDVIMMDPPWQLASSNPTRGVAIGYQQLSDSFIQTLPIGRLQDDGLLFVWVINAKYRMALQLIHEWGYHLIQDIAWVKQTVNNRIARGHGFYLQHAKETCLVAMKGKMENIKKKLQSGVCSDVIYSERRGQSQKPREIYEYIEKLIPNGYYLEIFGRRNNLRNGWVTIGNEL